MSTETMDKVRLTDTEIKNLPALVELRCHLEAEREAMRQNGRSLLVGSQWIIIQIFATVEKPDAKILGRDRDSNDLMSAPMSTYRDRQYCGISYFDADYVAKKTAQEKLRQVSITHGTPFAFYNPYQNRLLQVIYQGQRASEGQFYFILQE